LILRKFPPLFKHGTVVNIRHSKIKLKTKLRVLSFRFLNIIRIKSTGDLANVLQAYNYVINLYTAAVGIIAIHIIIGFARYIILAQSEKKIDDNK